MNAYVESLKNSTDLGIINIIMRDYVSPYKNCLALQLNIAKGIVKAADTATYQAMIAANLQ